MATGFLDANRRPLKAHENILFFCRKWYSSAYTPQKTPAKNKVRRRSGDLAEHYGAHKRIESCNNGLAHPRSVLKFRNVSGGFFGKNHEPSLHPTQKPLGLMEWLVLTYTHPEMTVLDPFSGSASTAIACLKTGRNYIGIEKDPTYHALSLQRIAQHQEVPHELAA